MKQVSFWNYLQLERWVLNCFTSLSTLPLWVCCSCLELCLVCNGIWIASQNRDFISFYAKQPCKSKTKHTSVEICICWRHPLLQPWILILLYSACWVGVYFQFTVDWFLRVTPNYLSFFPALDLKSVFCIKLWQWCFRWKVTTPQCLLNNLTKDNNFDS